MPRLAGKNGTVWLGPNRIADINNITLEIEQELAECSVKLEVPETYAPGRITSRLTGERYITDTTTNIGANPAVGGSVMGAQLSANKPAANTYVGATVTWRFHTLTAGAFDTATAGFDISGEGFIERVTAQNPRGAASEVWEIRNTTVPVFTS